MRGLKAFSAFLSSGYSCHSLASLSVEMCAFVFCCALILASCLVIGWMVSDRMGYSDCFCVVVNLHLARFAISLGLLRDGLLIVLRCFG